MAHFFYKYEFTPLYVHNSAFAYYICFYLNSRLPSIQNRTKALMVWILFLEYESQKHQKYPFLIQFTNTLDTFTYRNPYTSIPPSGQILTKKQEPSPKTSSMAAL